VRRPPIMTWSDVRWTLFVIAGLAFLYAVMWVVFLSATLPGPWNGILWAVASILILLLIGLELRRFWARYRR
jgi:hypothetical protein